MNAKTVRNRMNFRDGEVSEVRIKRALFADDAPLTVEYETKLHGRGDEFHNPVTKNKC